MNTSNIQLHYLQLEIIKKLILQPRLRFKDLLIDGLESEHVNYHLQKLLDFKLIVKESEFYTLTDAGKDYSNLLDDDASQIEKQPKTSVLLHIVRRNQKQEIEHLLCKRLKQPYYGKVGRLTGKIRFGETFQTAAERELFEETGLTARTLIIEEIYHKLRYREDGTPVQDGIMYIFFIKDIEGNLIEKLPYQENFWLTSSQLKQKTDLDLFENFELDDRYEPRELRITESTGLAKGY